MPPTPKTQTACPEWILSLTMGASLLGTLAHISSTVCFVTVHVLLDVIVL